MGQFSYWNGNQTIQGSSKTLALVIGSLQALLEHLNEIHGVHVKLCIQT